MNARYFSRCAITDVTALVLVLGIGPGAVAQENKADPAEPWRDPNNPAVIKLNPEDPTLELWRQRRDHSKRTPGPRYDSTASA